MKDQLWWRRQLCKAVGVVNRGMGELDMVLLVLKLSIISHGEFGEWLPVVKLRMQYSSSGIPMTGRIVKVCLRITTTLLSDNTTILIIDGCSHHMTVHVIICLVDLSSRPGDYHTRTQYECSRRISRRHLASSRRHTSHWWHFKASQAR
jgi:hypothetical protein